MPYATRAEMEARYGAEELAQLTDRLGTGLVADDVLARALADADAEVDAYLGGRYTLPLTSTPPVLVRVACDIARYRLWADMASEEVRARYEDARRMLEQIASGAVRLGSLSAGTPKPEGLAAAKSGRTPVFANMEAY